MKALATRVGLAGAALSLHAAAAGSLIHVKDAPICFAQQICEEWQLAEQPAFRIVTNGYEDGTDTRIYKVDKSGAYIPLVDINPITRDAAGQFWVGYPWRIAEMPYEVNAKGLTV